MKLKGILSKVAAMALLLTGFAFAGAATSPVEASSAGGAQFDGIGIILNSDGAISIGGDKIQASQTDVWNELMNRFQIIVMGITGLGTIGMVLFFIINFIKLGQASGNPSEVSKIQKALFWSGIAAAGLGSTTLIVGLFYGILR